jgi:hypothetical protein
MLARGAAEVRDLHGMGTKTVTELKRILKVQGRKFLSE